MSSTEETPGVEPTYGDGNYTVPSTEIELRQKVDWLRTQLETVREDAERAAMVKARTLGPLDDWVRVLADYDQLAQTLSRTEFVPEGFRGKPEPITAAMMYGREIGLPPLTTLQNTHVIKGRVGMYAEQLRAMILAAGHEYAIDEMTSDRCVISARRKDSDRWETFTYTMDQAKAAGLYVQNEQYRKRPVEMLFARCSGVMAHAKFPDVIRGMSALEEIEVDDVDAPPMVEAKPAASTVQRKASRSKAKQLEAAPVASSEVGKPETVVPDKAGIPPLPGEGEAPGAVSDEPRRMNVDEALASAAGPTGHPDQMTDEQYEQFRQARMTGPDNETPPVNEEYIAQSGAVETRPKPMHTAQTKALQARFKGLGFTDEPDDREQRLMIATAIVGHDVDTFRSTGDNTLTYDEADQIMRRLAPCRSREDVIELMVRISQDAAAEEVQG